MVTVMLYPGMFCVSLSMDLFVLCVACLSVFVNCFKQTVSSLLLAVCILVGTVSSVNCVQSAFL